MPSQQSLHYRPDEQATARSKHCLENNVRNERTAGFPSRLIYRTCLEIASERRAPAPPLLRLFLCLWGRTRPPLVNGLSKLKFHWLRGCGPTNISAYLQFSIFFWRVLTSHVVIFPQVMWFDNKSCGNADVGLLIEGKDVGSASDLVLL